jgi:hypothetical protein
MQPGTTLYGNLINSPLVYDPYNISIVEAGMRDPQEHLMISANGVMRIR